MPKPSRRLVPAAIITPLLAVTLSACGGSSPATRGHDQAVQACTAARDHGPASADALVHAHQAAGLDSQWSPLASALGRIAVTKTAFGGDLGDNEGVSEGTGSLQAVVSACARVGIAVSASGTAGSPVG